MPPIENVTHFALNRAADQIWQNWLAVGYRGNWALTVSPLRIQSLTELPGRRTCRLLNQTDAIAHIGAFDLSHHNIKVPPLVFWPIPDRGIVEKYRQPE